MAICHSDSDLGEVAQSAHAVDTFRHFDCLQEFKRELVVDENATVTAAHENFVNSDDRAVHLSPLDVEYLDRVGRLSAEYINVVFFVVHQEHAFANCLYVLNLVAFDPMDVCRGFLFFVEVGELPDVAQVFLTHEFIRILSRLLDLGENLDAAKVKLCSSRFGSRRHQRGD